LKDGESYGVLVLYSDYVEIYDEKSVKLMNAIGTRISPLFVNSITFEKSLNNAMIDSLTKLPNERALFFVLENQIAESQRLREQRPLTILSIDVQGFSDLNKNYGHILGDRILSFVADNIKIQLRQMDFLSRINGDDFLAVLPTSSQETTEIIVERIEKNFETKPFVFDDGGNIFIKLHFGSAVFLTDGETSDDLLKIAKLRKQEAKSPIKTTVLWFPKELVN
jgi:diguanylate cyclase (GGDEF)-like protein